MCVCVYVLYVNILPASDKTNNKCKEQIVRPKANRMKAIECTHITDCLLFLFLVTCACICTDI